MNQNIENRDFNYFVLGYYDDKVIEFNKSKDINLFKKLILNNYNNFFESNLFESAKENYKSSFNNSSSNFDELDFGVKLDIIKKYLKNYHDIALYFFNDIDPAIDFINEKNIEQVKFNNLINNGLFICTETGLSNSGFVREVYRSSDDFNDLSLHNPTDSAANSNNDILNELNSLAELSLDNAEVAHERADALITTFLTEKGFDDIANAYSNIRKYYA